MCFYEWRWGSAGCWCIAHTGCGTSNISWEILSDAPPLKDFFPFPRRLLWMACYLPFHKSLNRVRKYLFLLMLSFCFPLAKILSRWLWLCICVYSHLNFFFLKFWLIRRFNCLIIYLPISPNLIKYQCLFHLWKPHLSYLNPFMNMSVLTDPDKEDHILSKDSLFKLEVLFCMLIDIRW